MHSPCLRCKDNTYPGYVKIRKRGSSETHYTPCSCLISYRKNKKLELSLRESNITLKVLNNSLEDYKGNKSKSNIENLKNYVDDFKKDSCNPFLYLWGPPGTQKTTLASIVVKNILIKHKNIKAFYIEDMDQIVEMFGSFDDKNEKKDIREKVLNCDILVIDESFFKKYHNSVSDYQIKNIRKVLKHRMEVKVLPTIFISNISPIEISKHGYPSAIQDLIIRNCRENILKFEDNYMDNNNDFDINNFQLY